MKKFNKGLSTESLLNYHLQRVPTFDRHFFSLRAWINGMLEAPICFEDLKNIFIVPASPSLELCGLRDSAGIIISSAK